MEKSHGSSDSALNERPRPLVVNIKYRDLCELVAIQNFEGFLLPAHHLSANQSPEGLVGVHERHAEGIGQMLLRERKLDLVGGGEANVLGAQIEMEKHEGNALEGVAASDADEMLVDQLLLARSKPSEIEGERGIARVEIPKLFSWEDA